MREVLTEEDRKAGVAPYVWPSPDSLRRFPRKMLELLELLDLEAHMVEWLHRIVREVALVDAHQDAQPDFASPRVRMAQALHKDGYEPAQITTIIHPFAKGKERTSARLAVAKRLDLRSDDVVIRQRDKSAAAEAAARAAGAFVLTGQAEGLGLRRHLMAPRATESIVAEEWRTLPDPPPWRFREGLAAPIILENDSLLTVFETGLRADATTHISESLRAALFDTQVMWLASQEPSPYAGPAGSPIAVSISKDATFFSMAVVQSEGRLTRAAHWFGETGGCTIGSDTGCDPSLASSVASTPSDAPAARHDFSAVYSKARSRVLVAGGRDASGKLLDDAWYFTGELGWKKIALPSGVLGEVRSSAYSYRDGHLWVLDVDPLDAKRAQLRVLRIEPETGAFEVVLRAGSDRPAAKYDERGLLIGMNGEVLLYASSTQTQKHRIASLETIPGGVAARMTLRRDRALAAPPIVDLHGVALYFQPDHPPQDRSKNADDDPQRTSNVAGLRLDSLPLRAATLQQVEELLR